MARKKSASKEALSFRLNPELVRRVKDFAKADNRTVSAVYNMAIKEFVRSKRSTNAATQQENLERLSQTQLLELLRDHLRHAVRLIDRLTP